MSKRTAVVVGLVFGLGLANLGFYGMASAAYVGLPVWWLDQ